MKATYKTLAALAATVLTLALGIAASFWSFSQLESAADARKHSSIILNQADDLLSALKDVETSQRGYLMTGDEAFLEPYLPARDQIGGQLTTLRQQTRIPAGQQRLDALAPLVDAKLAHVAQAIALYRGHQEAAAMDSVRGGEGKRLMDAIRAEVAGYIQVQEVALARTETTFQATLRRQFMIIVLSSLLALAFSLSFAYLLYRESQQRLKNLVHLETRHLLAAQEAINSQLQHANLTLQTSEDRLAVTLSSIGDAVIATDSAARVTLLNPVAEQLTGWTQAQALGRAVDEVFHIVNKDTRQLATLPVAETLAQGTVQGLANHTVLIARDGQEFDIADSCAPIRDPNGQVVGAVLVFRNVTDDYAAQHALHAQRTELEVQNEELRQSQAALEASQGRYFDLYDLAPVGYCTINEPGLVVEANLTAATMLGLSRGAFVNQPFVRFILGDDADQYHLLRRAVLETTKPQAAEIRMIRHNGAPIWVQLTTTAAQHAGTSALRVTISDNTARKQAEAALLKAGALQKAIFDSANFSSIATDAKGVIQIFNVGAERMLGYAATDVMNKITPAEISDPQELIERAQALSAELGTQIKPGFEALVFKAARGIEDIYELSYIRKDGSRFPAVVSVTALRDAQEAIIGYLLIGTDNTARKQAEAALLKAGALQKAIFDSANFSSIATDAKGVIQIFNVGAERMLGYTAAEVMNKVTPAEISDPQEVIERAQALSAELGTQIKPGFDALVFKAARGIEDIYELTYIRKDGSRFPAVVSVTALRDDRDAIIGYLLIGTDNTARKLIEAERLHLLEIQAETHRQLQRTNLTLRESEEKLAVTLNSIGDAVIATDAQACVTLLNPLAEQLTGWTQAQAAGLPVTEIFHIINKETRQPATIPVQATLEHGTIQGLANHTVLIARDASECDIADSCAPIRDRDAKVIGAVLVFRDVTGEYAAQQALRDSAALIQTILNTVVDGIVTLRANGGSIETVNPAAEQMFGYAGSELIGEAFSTLIPELERDQSNGNGSLEYYGASDAARAVGLGREVVGRRKDGSLFPMEMAVSEMLLGGQRYFTGILRDITTRKQIEAEREKLDQRLRDQQFYTRSLIESNIDALITTDPSGIISDVNQQMEALTGCTRDELIGAPFKSYFTDPQLAEAGIKRVLNEKKVSNYELTARARDGTQTVVSYNATTFYDRDRRLQGVVAAARDVTERIRLDNALRETNAKLERARYVAEKASLAKSDFLSSMSHELRSPLNAILGFAQLMESGAPLPTPTQKASIDQILRAGWYLLELINEILDLALIESGKMSLSLEPISLPDVLRDCQAMIEPQAKQRGIRISFPQFDGPLVVNADRTRVKQVVINLLSNAIKYNKVGGTVEVTCKVNTGNRIRISVRDSGEGLAPEKLAQLFQAFNRLGQEAGTEEGTGIGLVVSKRLVEMMGGEIGVNSIVGVGSVFWIELNAVAALELAVAQEVPLASLHTRLAPGEALRTLLYVEDNRANMELVQQLIERRPDLRLLCAEDGTRGVALARAELPEVILMDINLPGISGLQALEILREDPRTQHIPVLALSANAMPRDIEKGMKAGFLRYLTKPIKVGEFMEALDMALDLVQDQGAGATTEKET